MRTDFREAPCMHTSISTDTSSSVLLSKLAFILQQFHLNYASLGYKECHMRECRDTCKVKPPTAFFPVHKANYPVLQGDQIGLTQFVSNNPCCLLLPCFLASAYKLFDYFLQYFSMVEVQLTGL